MTIPPTSETTEVIDTGISISIDFRIIDPARPISDLVNCFWNDQNIYLHSLHSMIQVDRAQIEIDGYLIALYLGGAIVHNYLLYCQNITNLPRSGESA